MTIKEYLKEMKVTLRSCSSLSLEPLFVDERGQRHERNASPDGRIPKLDADQQGRQRTR